MIRLQLFFRAETEKGLNRKHIIEGNVSVLHTSFTQWRSSYVSHRSQKFLIHLDGHSHDYIEISRTIKFVVVSQVILSPYYGIWSINSSPF